MYKRGNLQGAGTIAVGNKTILLVTVLTISIIFNGIMAGFIFQRYGAERVFAKAGEMLGFGSPVSNDASNNNYLAEAEANEFTPPVIPEIYTQDILSMSFDKHVKSKADFESWKQSVLEKFSEELQMPDISSLPLETPIEMKREDLGKAILTKYSMNAFDEDTIIFYEVIPKDKTRASSDGKLPAVLVFPGSGNQGARDVLNRPSELAQYYYQSEIGLEIAEEGYAVYVIVNRGWGQRAIEVNDACSIWDEINQEISCSGVILGTHLKGLGYNLVGLQVADGLQLLKHISSLDYVDSKRIAVGGLSLGGGLAHAVSMFDQNITATFIASGTGSVAKTFSIESGGNSLKYYDNPDLLATLAPAYLYLSFGNQEKGVLLYEAQSSYTYNYVKRAYELFDAENNLVYVVHDGKHEYHVPSVLQFLDETIG